MRCQFSCSRLLTIAKALNWQYTTVACNANVLRYRNVPDNSAINTKVRKLEHSKIRVLTLHATHIGMARRELYPGRPQSNAKQKLVKK